MCQQRQLLIDQFVWGTADEFRDYSQVFLSSAENLNLVSNLQSLPYNLPTLFSLIEFNIFRTLPSYLYSVRIGTPYFIYRLSNFSRSITSLLDGPLPEFFWTLTPIRLQMFFCNHMLTMFLATIRSNFRSFTDPFVQLCRIVY